ncbi:MAG: T9SS type A sorting domain-containing protein [Salibacteraceae bacterium]
MKKILPFILSVIVPVLGFSQADSISYGPGYTEQVYYSFANGEVHSSDNTSWDLAFGTGGFDTDIRINDGFGAELYLYPHGDTAAWNTVDTTGMQNWTPRYNSDTSWQVTAFAGPNISHPDYGWGIYNSTSHNVEGDSIYIIKLTDGSYKKLKMDVMAVTGMFTFSYADVDGSNEIQGSFNKNMYSTKKHVYYALTNDSVMDLEPIEDSWDIVFTKYQQAQPQGGYYKVTGVLAAGGRTLAEARGVDLTTVGWYGQDYTTNIGTIGSDWKSFNMGTFAYDIVDSLTYFLTDTNEIVWQLTFTGFEGSSTGKTTFNKAQVGVLSVEKSPLALNSVSVYPNPAINTATVAIESEVNQDNLNVTVYSLTGSVVYAQIVNVVNKTTVNIPVSNWNKGMYLVRIGNDANAVVKQLIVQ